MFLFFLSFARLRSRGSDVCSHTPRSYRRRRLGEKAHHPLEHPAPRAGVEAGTRRLSSLPINRAPRTYWSSLRSCSASWPAELSLPPSCPPFCLSLYCRSLPLFSLGLKRHRPRPSSWKKAFTKAASPSGSSASSPRSLPFRRTCLLLLGLRLLHLFIKAFGQSQHLWQNYPLQLV